MLGFSIRGSQVVRTSYMATRGTPFAQYTTLTAQELAEVYQNEGVEVTESAERVHSLLE